MSALAQKIREEAREPGVTTSGVAERIGTTTGYVSVVLRRAGIDIVSDQQRSKNRAVAVWRNPPWTRVSRSCLCCREQFWSEGPHNRLCTPCRHLPTEWP